MSDQIKLTEAIKANRHGIERLVDQHGQLCVEIRAKQQLERQMSCEIDARRAMDQAMINLQSVFPADETIKFVIPHAIR